MSFVNIFGEEYDRNPNEVDIILLKAEVKVLVKLVRKTIESGETTCDENYYLFSPILSKLEKVIEEKEVMKENDDIKKNRECHCN